MASAIFNLNIGCVPPTTPVYISGVLNATGGCLFDVNFYSSEPVDTNVDIGWYFVDDLSNSSPFYTATITSGLSSTYMQVPRDCYALGGTVAIIGFTPSTSSTQEYIAA